MGDIKLFVDLCYLTFPTAIRGASFSCGRCSVNYKLLNTIYGLISLFTRLIYRDGFI
jgi:hypothetical protein